MCNYILIFILFCITSNGLWARSERVIIAGVCRNVEGTLPNMISSIEALGSQFTDYVAIIYENNSHDATASKLRAWAERNHHVVFLSETLDEKKRSLSRTARIANARNKVLKEASKKKYKDFTYFIMTDMDFKTPLPTQEIVKSIHATEEWDCIAANGTISDGVYFDRLAYRSKQYPFGPELINQDFWAELYTSANQNWFRLNGEKWLPVFSAFGGLAIYKTKTITQFSYSGTVTKKLKRYYEKIVPEITLHNPQLRKYITKYEQDPARVRIIFQQNCMEWQAADDTSIACCEHVTLHAAMALKGYGKFFINPKMVLRY